MRGGSPRCHHLPALCVIFIPRAPPPRRLLVGSIADAIWELGAADAQSSDCAAADDVKASFGQVLSELSLLYGGSAVNAQHKALMRLLGQAWADVMAARGRAPDGKLITHTFSVVAADWETSGFLKSPAVSDAASPAYTQAMLQSGMSPPGKVEYAALFKAAPEQCGVPASTCRTAQDVMSSYMRDVDAVAGSKSWTDMNIPFLMWSEAGNVDRYSNVPVFFWAPECGSDIVASAAGENLRVTMRELRFAASVTVIGPLSGMLHPLRTPPAPSEAALAVASLRRAQFSLTPYGFRLSPFKSQSQTPTEHEAARVVDADAVFRYLPDGVRLTQLGCGIDGEGVVFMTGATPLTASVPRECSRPFTAPDSCFVGLNTVDRRMLRLASLYNSTSTCPDCVVNPGVKCA